MEWEYVSWNIDLYRLAYLYKQWNERPRVSASLIRISRLFEAFLGIDSSKEEPSKQAGDVEAAAEKVSSEEFKRRRKLLGLPEIFGGDTEVVASSVDVTNDEVQARRACLDLEVC